MTSLKEEIRQKSGFTSLEQEAYLNVVRTAAVLSDAMEQVLRQFGVTGAQYNVLRILHGGDPNGLCRNEVRDRMVTRMPDMTRMLDRMEAAGLVERTRSTVDRRHVSTRITEKGEAIVRDAAAAVAAEHERQLGHMSDKELATLVDLLTTARDYVGGP